MNIENFNPCEDGVEFYKKFESFELAWNACERGDWMLWIASKLCVDIKVLALAKGYCAQTVLHLMQDQHSKDAVQASIDFGLGKISQKELSAAYAAYAAEKIKNQKQTAEICKKYLTESVLKLAL